MKKLLAILFALCIPFVAVAAADEGVPEMVVQMTYIVKMPDVIREGLYTGQIQNGVPHGYGLFETANSSGIKWHYVGTWTNGEMTGEGGQYWDVGQAQVGSFEQGALICGFLYQATSKNSWVDYRPDKDGQFKIRLFRTDGSMYFDGYANLKTGVCTEGVFYNKKGEVFFEGKIGEGFDWNYIYID